MIQYFQLTPEILLEYVYDGDPKLNKGNIKDISDIKNGYPTMMLKSNAFGSKYLCFKNESEGLDSFSNLVLPINNTETQFVVAKSKYQNFFSTKNISNRFSSKSGGGYIYEDTQYDKKIIEKGEKGESCDVTYDKCIVHFTSRNYFGNYDSLIFQAYVYMSNKAKMYFASFLFKKTSNLELKSEHLLYNEKLYTTQIEFDIPSVLSIFRNDNEVFNNALEEQGIKLLENTPVVINIYGVTGATVGIDNYDKLKTNKINSISIPYIYKTLDGITIDIYEDIDDGDYYYINPNIKGYSSFVDYIESMGEDIRAYMVMHELCLRETWVDEDNVIHSEITHKEFHIININEDDEDDEISKKFDAKIKYRPICIKSGSGCSATIIDTIKIINTVDGSSYEVTASEDISNPKKYGVKFKRLENINRPIVNVYNKNILERGGSSSASDKGVIVLNKNGGFTIENNSKNITSFIESTNIGVSVVELSPEDIN
jgi:hypothetical protein